MMSLITGMPGNGKTLYAVDLIYKARKKGQAVYSDIRGLKIEGVMPIPDDWRDCPPGCLIVYDEAHQRFPSYKGKGRSPNELVRVMDEHRGKYGLDMVFITQWPDKMDGELFRLVGEHLHLNRAMGLQKASVVKFSRATMNPYSASARKGCDEELWDYPQARYLDYDSSINHTGAHKFQLPKKVKNALITAPIALLVLWGFFAFMQRQFVGGAEKERSGAEPTQSAPATNPQAFVPISPSDSKDISLTPGMGLHSPIRTAAVPTLAGCVASDRGCRCFNVEGYQIDMAERECRSTLDQPLPFNVYHAYSQGRQIAQDNNQAPDRGAGDTPAETASPGTVIASGRFDLQGREMIYTPSGG